MESKSYLPYTGCQVGNYVKKNTTKMRKMKYNLTVTHIIYLHIALASESCKLSPTPVATPSTALSTSVAHWIAP